MEPLLFALAVILSSFAVPPVEVSAALMSTVEPEARSKMPKVLPLLGRVILLVAETSSIWLSERS